MTYIYIYIVVFVFCALVWVEEDLDLGYISYFLNQKKKPKKPRIRENEILNNNLI